MYRLKDNSGLTLRRTASRDFEDRDPLEDLDMLGHARIMLGHARTC